MRLPKACTPHALLSATLLVTHVVACSSDSSPASGVAVSSGGEGAANDTTGASNQAATADSTTSASAAATSGSASSSTTNSLNQGATGATGALGSTGASSTTATTTAAALTTDTSAVTGAGGTTSASTTDSSSVTSTGGSGTTDTSSTTSNTTGDSGTVTFVPGDYVSRKWARWPIPNPPSLNLPNPMSYAASGDEVLDEVTGLTWRAGTNSSTRSWQDALAYCEGLGEGWSLPTRIELTSIVDNTVSGAKWNASVFSGSAGWTWASTPWVVNERRSLTGSAALSWFINFAVGDSNNSLSQTATSAYSRCVKLPPSRELPAEHYTATDQVVTDHYTGLVWQRAHSGAAPSLGFDAAVSYCEALELEGGGWRLPSLNELASLVDDVPSGDVSPAIDHDIFPETAPDALYWSLSSYGTNTGEHWTLNFEDGFTAHDANGTVGIARCVR